MWSVHNYEVGLGLIVDVGLRIKYMAVSTNWAVLSKGFGALP